MDIFERIEELGGIKRLDGEVMREVVRDVTAEDVRRVEEVVGQPLPEDYARFLRAFGSGAFTFREMCVFPVPQIPDGRESIDRFLGAVPNDGFYQYDLKANYEFFCTGSSPIIAPGLLPIASMGGGDILCLAVGDGARRGEVLYWNHEEAEDDEVETALYLVAPSFSDFLGLLERGDWDDEGRWVPLGAA